MCPRAPHRETWWTAELIALRPRLLGYLRRRGLSWIADDVIARVSLELADLDKAGRFPARNVQELSGLLWTMTKFRARDELRARVVREHVMAPEEEGSIGAGAVDETLVHRLEARDFLAAIASRMENLPERDKKLLMREVEHSDEEPSSGKDRIRLLRLRRELADAVLTDLRRRIPK